MAEFQNLNQYLSEEEGTGDAYPNFSCVLLLERGCPHNLDSRDGEVQTQNLQPNAAGHIPNLLLLVLTSAHLSAPKPCG